MGLQASQAHVLGEQQKLFAMVETTPGTFLKPTGTPTAAASAGIERHPNCITTTMVPNIARKDRTDAYMASRDVLERITGKSEHSWSYEGYYVPSGTKNRSPDVGPFLVASGMTETVNANDVTFSQHSNQTISTLSLTRHFQEIWQEAMAGCVVDTWSLEFAGGAEPMFKASGRAMSYAATGTGTTNGAIAPAATTLVLTAAGTNALDCQASPYGTNPPTAGNPATGARSVIKINDGSSPDSDIEVIVCSSAPSFTTTAMTNGSDSGAAVTPYVPTHTNLGSPISGTAGTFTWDSFAIRPTAVAINYNNTMIYNDDEAFQPGMSDAIPTIREITGSMTFRVRQDHAIYILDRKQFAVRALSLTVGGADQSGTRLVVSMPYCEGEYNEVGAPQNGEATINYTFKALGSSGNDAITLTHS